MEVQNDDQAIVHSYESVTVPESRCRKSKTILCTFPFNIQSNRNMRSLLFLMLIQAPLLALCSKAYPIGCANKPPSYYDYEFEQSPNENNEQYQLLRMIGVKHLNIPQETSENFWLLKRLGNGKFSDVFEAVIDSDLDHSSPIGKEDDKEKNLVVIKCLKPVASRKIRREVLVLKRASECINLVKLLAIVTDYKDPDFRMPALVMEHAGSSSRWFSHTVAQTSDNPSLFLTIHQIKYYLYHLLMALNSLHSCGIMHRDVKPRNVLINIKKTEGKQSVHRPLLLIDLGLADFYFPSQRYNTRVASRHYKSPELLVGDELYDYAIDMWGVGCILAGLLFRKEPFFRGKDNIDQLLKIVQVLGTNDLIKYYCKERKISMPPELRQYFFPSIERSGTSTTNVPSKQTPESELPKYRQSWAPFIPTVSTQSNDGSDITSLDYQQGLDLLDKLLVYNHEKRWNAKEAMTHEFFDDVRDQIQKEISLS